MSIDDFAGTTPEFRPETFLVGTLQGWGLLENLTGGLQRRFTVDARGALDETRQVVSFNETWTFDNGRSDTLDWKITKLGPGSYTGTETRIDGVAKGEQRGCAFHWKYSRETPQDDGKSTLLNFNDWFYLIDERVAVVRGSAGRLGIAFAIAHVTYRRGNS